jgi:predicted esterase
MEPMRVFIHGLESSGRGNKGMFFRERYPGMIIEDFDGPFAQRMEKLEELLAGKNGLLVVGSSFGGLMAAAYACLHEERVAKLVLLAPALHLEPFRPHLEKVLRMPVAIFHGLHDSVVPLDAVQMIAKRSFANHTFTLLDDDHPLHETFATLNWNALLTL